MPQTNFCTGGQQCNFASIQTSKQLYTDETFEEESDTCIGIPLRVLKCVQEFQGSNPAEIQTCIIKISNRKQPYITVYNPSWAKVKPQYDEFLCDLYTSILFLHFQQVHVYVSFRDIYHIDISMECIHVHICSQWRSTVHANEYTVFCKAKILRLSQCLKDNTSTCLLGSTE